MPNKIKTVRKIRGTKGGKFPKDAPKVKISTLRTEQACSRAMVFLERHQRRAFIAGMRLLKPQIEEWARYVKYTQGKDSADLAEIQKFWSNMVARYKSYRHMEQGYGKQRPRFDPDLDGKIYGG